MADVIAIDGRGLFRRVSLTALGYALFIAACAPAGVTVGYLLWVSL